MASSVLAIVLLMGAVAALWSVPVVVRARANPVPDGAGRSILPEDALAAMRLVGSQQHLGQIEMVDVPGRPFGPALRLATRNGASSEWNVQTIIETAGGLAVGDVVLARFWVRCTESMTGEGSIGFVIEEKGGEYNKAVEMRLGAQREWIEQFVPFRATRAFAAGEAQVCLRVGYDRQTIEVAGLQVINFGRDVKLEDLPRTKLTYGGREQNARWRTEAAARIEKHRKADLQISVVDAAGRSINGAQVRAQLKRHAFAFGTCVDARVLMGVSPDSAKYRQIVERYFNATVFENDMKWPALYNGVPAVLDQALAWLSEREFRVRGHNLVWPSWRWMPRELVDQHRENPEALRRITADHITRTVGRFAGQLYQWDVVNEPYSEHDLIDALGGERVMVEWYKLAKAADPACRLFLNDYGIFDSGRGVNDHEEHFHRTIKFLIDSGAPLDGIGIQSHFTSDLPAPAELVRTLDRFSEFGLPIESTELSVNIDDRALQADYLRDYMIAVFSHPNVEGIMLWGFWSKRHWREDAALWGDDWQIRPIGQAWVDLVHGEWKTDTTAATDAAGRVIVRGFLGQYDITVTLPDGRSKIVQSALGRDGAAVRIVVD